MKLGLIDIEGVYLGETQIEKVYLGYEPIYEESSYEQKWVDENPGSSQIGKIPLDESSLSSMIISSEEKLLSTGISTDIDNASTSSMLIASTETLLSTNISSLMDSSGASSLLVDVKEISLED